MSQLSILFVLYPEVTHLDFTGPHQVLCRVPGAKVTVASMGGVDIVGDGLTFSNLTDLKAVQSCDIICIPGGFGTTAAMLDADFMAEVTRLAKGAKYLTSVCTGSLILAATGLIKGRRAACHWAWRELLTPFGVIIDEGRVARDGNLITGGGVTAGLDFAFTLAAELAGDTFAQTLQLGLEYAPFPPFNSGRPELAAPEVLAAMKASIDPGMGGRREAAFEAARRLGLS